MVLHRFKHDAERFQGSPLLSRLPNKKEPEKAQAVLTILDLISGRHIDGVTQSTALSVCGGQGCLALGQRQLGDRHGRAQAGVAAKLAAHLLVGLAGLACKQVSK